MRRFLTGRHLVRRHLTSAGNLALSAIAAFAALAVLGLRRGGAGDQQAYRHRDQFSFHRILSVVPISSGQ